MGLCDEGPPPSANGTAGATRCREVCRSSAGRQSGRVSPVRSVQGSAGACCVDITARWRANFLAGDAASVTFWCRWYEYVAMNALETRTDAELLAATPSDADAFAAFYRRHVRAVVNYVARRAPTADVGDLVSELFATALVHRRRLTRSSGRAKRGWSVLHTTRLLTRGGEGW
jgi:hypothetical protein